MATYTIAYTGDMLIATVKDGDSINTAVRAYCLNARIDFITDYRVEHNLVLTNETIDDDIIIWDANGGHGGFLMDENGTTFNYAIR